MAQIKYDRFAFHTIRRCLIPSSALSPALPSVTLQYLLATPALSCVRHDQLA